MSSILYDKNSKAIYRLDKYLTYAVIIFVILEGPTVYCNITVFNVGDLSLAVYAIKSLLMLFAAALFLVQFFKYKIKARELKQLLILGGVYYFIIAAEFFATIRTVDMSNYAYYFVILLPLLIAIIYFKMCNREYKTLFYTFSNLMIVISVVSLFFWIFGSILGIIRPNGTIHSLWGGYDSYPTYFGMYFEKQTIDVTTDIFTFRVWRNQGIFVEAPMYNAYLTVAICIEIYLRPWYDSTDFTERRYRLSKNKSIARIVTLFVTMFTTLTTSGIILAIVMLVSLFFLYMFRDKFRFKLILGIVIGVVAGILCIYVFVDKLGSGSGKIRIDDFFACFDAWRESPVFGVGVMNYDAIIKHMSFFRMDNTGVATGLGKILAQGGALLLSVYIVPMIFWIVRSVRNRSWNMLCFCMIFGVLFVTATIEYTAMFMLILALPYADMLCAKDKAAFVPFALKKQIAF